MCTCLSIRGGDGLIRGRTGTSWRVRWTKVPRATLRSPSAPTARARTRPAACGRSSSICPTTRSPSACASSIPSRPRSGRSRRYARAPLPDPSGGRCTMHPTMPPSSDVIDAIGGLLPPLLHTLERITWVQRHLYPPLAPRLAEELAPSTDAVAGPLGAVEALVCPDELRFMRDRLVEVARQTLDLVADFVEAARSPGEPIGLYRALRRFARIQEALYPLAPALEPVSRWFLEPPRRGDDALVERLRAAALRDDETRRGVLHASNEREVRGGFSLYVPEASDGQAPMPPVVALHGAHGHGRDFLWSWLRGARRGGVRGLAPPPRARRATRTPGSSTGWRPTLRLEDHPGGRRARALALPLGEGEGLVDVGEREAVRDDLRQRVLVLGAHEEIEGGGHDPRVVVHQPRPVDR